MFDFFRKPTGKFFAVIFVAAGFLFFQNAARAATTGEIYPTLGTTVSESPWSDNTWNTPTNIYSDNAATANVTAASYDTPDQTFVLKATGFNFSAIPDGSTINGVTVRMNAFYRSGQGSGSMDLCQLLNVSRAKVGTNKCSTPVALTTNTATIITQGGSADTWGNALTTAWVKDPDFGIAIGVLATAQNADVDVDYVTVEITYTPPAVPTVTSPTVTSITTTGAILGATVASLGVPASISVRGTCWGATASPTTNCLAEGGTTTGVFTHARTGMSPSTFYYYRGYATNSTGTGYSADGTFTTSASTFAITASSGANGAVTPSGVTNVVQGDSQVYAITPDSGYDVATLLIDGGSIATSTTYTFTNVQAPHTIHATFTLLPTPPVAFAITASSGANGAVTPSGVTNVAQGDSQVYAIAPDSGYDIATLLIDGGSVATSTSYTFTDVQATHTIHATFALLPTPPVTHTITASAGPNGMISPLGAITVTDGASQTFNITPNGGFTIETLIVDSISIATTTTHDFINVTADHTISATFSLIPTPPGSFTIIANQNANGTIAPSGSTIVSEGGSQAYTITPDSGYDVGTLIIDSFPVATTTNHTFTNVTADHTIEATFVALPGAVPAVSVPRRLASIIFSGKAFPGGKISIIQKELNTENVTDQKETTNIDGSFQIRFTDLQTGAHSFGLLIKDPEGRSSQTKFFLVDANRGDEIFKDIIAPPTIDILSGQVSRGGNVKVFGYASPSHTIRVYFNDILMKEVLAGRGGVYSFDIPTGALDFGQYKVRTKQINLDGGKESDFSTTRTVIVSKLAVVKADLSGDGKVDIKDWSIFLARWVSKNSPGRMGIDLNGDGKVDIGDFSIFIKTIRKK
ncbi:MAG: hypothetical protein AAB497_03005 [Patescibacteria group bacterium]